MTQAMQNLFKFVVTGIFYFRIFLGVATDEMLAN
jgi:hypothetical protein